MLYTGVYRIIAHLQFALQRIIIIINLSDDVGVHFIDGFRWNTTVILNVFNITVDQMLNVICLLENHIFAAPHLVHNVRGSS